MDENTYTLSHRIPTEDELLSYEEIDDDKVENMIIQWKNIVRSIFQDFFEDRSMDIKSGTIDGVRFEDTKQTGVRSFKVHIDYSVDENAENWEFRAEIGDIIRNITNKSDKGYLSYDYSI